ncbi:unnamed protein product [Lepeophtheirus salmonis]|uniref:(salmon louse) hypothetical protein n=1 Tax=Lepeophtheirus salmonis TaxID=72036 RepID=A0A7R8CBQ6_LEPSM|nr:unnamed protein product [Lepeophtheirus salmonis]CAF2762890.1 unnamed protein product [Lepeophtheirus salmonis]
MSLRNLIPPILQKWCLEPQNNSSSPSNEHELQPRSPPLKIKDPPITPPPSPIRSDPPSINFPNKERKLFEEVLIKNFETNASSLFVPKDYAPEPRNSNSLDNGLSKIGNNKNEKPLFSFSSQDLLSKDEARKRMLSWRRTTKIRKTYTS